MASQNPPLHALVYGESGSKKSTFAATFPKPILVFFFDPIGKDNPYLRTGNPSGLIPSQFPGFGQQEIYNGEGELLIRLEYFLDSLPITPTGFPNFLARFAQVQRGIVSGVDVDGVKWATLVFDSATFMELAARKYSQYTLNPNTKDPRQWFASCTDQMEEILMMSVGGLPINVVTICHIDEDKDEVAGGMVRNPKLPGRLRKGAASGYGEFYRSWIKQEAGESLYLLQTKGNGLFNAASQILAPDNSPPNYDALWKSSK